ncbi:hypothetical protein BH11MYX1_BH11MYX1_48920 [soil metagenome]
MALAACGSPQRAPFEGAAQGPTAELADADDTKPTYGNAELEKALIAERGAEATNERRVAEAEAKDDSDAAMTATADLAVRRRFIANLEACQATGHRCPPRLDEPAWTLDAPLRFDLADWQKLATELHGHACACRTIACVDAMDVMINQLEQRPMQEVAADEPATLEITRARECLFRLRGKSIAKVTRPE